MPITNSTTAFNIFLLIGISLSSCQQQKKSDSTISSNVEQIAIVEIPTFNANVATEIDKNIRSIFQDNRGNYWFGTNGAGVYRYDGNTLLQFTEKDGLANNQIQSIQEDKSGNIWFGTGQFGVSRFDGKTFITFTNYLNNSSATDWKIERDDLWFSAGAGVYRHNKDSFSYLPFNQSDFNAANSNNSPTKLSAQSVYCTLKDSKGNAWFGTQSQGACRFNGKSLTWFTEKGLKGPAVLGLFEDGQGNIWFGNNGGGLFRFDGKNLINFTEENRLGNPEFRTSGKSGPGTLARVYSINEDPDGNIWIGTVDAGVWRYDGTNLTNFTTKDGLGSNAVNSIYKDKNGEIWFGTDDAGLFKFNGNTFNEFVVK